MFIHAEEHIYTPTPLHTLNLSHIYTHTNTLEAIRCVGPEPKMIYDPKKKLI